MSINRGETLSDTPNITLFGMFPPPPVWVQVNLCVMS